MLTENSIELKNILEMVLKTGLNGGINKDSDDNNNNNNNNKMYVKYYHSITFYSEEELQLLDRKRKEIMDLGMYMIGITRAQGVPSCVCIVEQI